MPYIITLFAILGLNSTLRMLTTRFHRATLTVLPGAGTTLVTLPLTSGFYPGQHLRIRVWSSNRKMGFAGWLEAHPFSIASAPGPESEVRLLVKKAGDWTTGLYDLAQAGQSVRRGEKWETVERRVLVTVEGPYGR
jgi:ferric-chelate reductase